MTTQYGDIILQGVHDFRSRITNTVAPLVIGAAGSSTRGLGANDLLLTGALEVDGAFYTDGTATLGGATTLANNVLKSDASPLFFGSQNPTTGSSILPYSSVGELHFAVGSVHGTSLILTTQANSFKDHDIVAATHPTFYLFSATDPDVANTEYGSLYHDGTHFVITTGAGNLSLVPASSIVSATGLFEMNDALRTVRGERIAAGNSSAYDLSLAVQGTHASPYATSNTKGGSLSLYPGIGSETLTVVNYATLSGFALLFYYRDLDDPDNQTVVTLTEGVDFTATTSNSQTASNIADAINGVGGTAPTAIADGAVVRLIPSDYTLNMALWVSSGQSSTWTVAHGTRVLNLAIGFNGTTAGATTINLGGSGDALNIGATLNTVRVQSGSYINFGASAASDFRLRQNSSNTFELYNANTLLTNWSADGLAYRRKSITLAAAATTFTPTNNVITLTGDAGGNTVSTITSTNTTYADGYILTIIFADDKVGITSTAYASRTTGQITLQSAFTSEAGAVLVLVRDGTGWVEVARSIVAGGGSGDVTGPGSSTDNAIARWDSTGGDTLLNSPVIIEDDGGIHGHKAHLNIQTGTAYTIDATDTGKHLVFTNSSAVTVTIPVSLLEGFQCTWEQRGTGQVSFDGTAVSEATLVNRQGHVASAGQYSVGGLSCYIGTGADADVTLYGDTGP